MYMWYNNSIFVERRMANDKRTKKSNCFCTAFGVCRLRTEHLFLYIRTARSWRRQNKRLLCRVAVCRCGAVACDFQADSVVIIYHRAADYDCRHLSCDNRFKTAVGLIRPPYYIGLSIKQHSPERLFIQSILFIIKQFFIDLSDGFTADNTVYYNAIALDFRIKQCKLCYF